MKISMTVSGHAVPTTSWVRGLWTTLLLSTSLLPFTHGLRHNYRTKNDGRTIIGPLGAPFGFTNTGHFNFTIFDFQITAGIHDKEFESGHGGDNGFRHQRELGIFGGKAKGKKNKVPTDRDPGEEIRNKLKGVGFLLKRFKDEAEFNHYMNTLHADPSICAFETILEEVEEEMDVLDDDYGAGSRSIDQFMADPINFGIFLNMMEPDRWAPSKVSVDYRFETEEEGLYFLIYQVCPTVENMDLHLHTEFALDFHFYNKDLFGNISYLSAGEMPLPHIFFYFSVLYAICLYLWISNIRLIDNGNPGHWEDGSMTGPSGPPTKPVVYPIHYLMGTLLALKFFSLLFESLRYHFLRVTGHATFWSGLYYTFLFLKGAFLFTIILLLGSGWSFVKPFLSDREKTMIGLILVLQVISNVARIVLTQLSPGERSFDRWTAIWHMVDILCCCAVLIPIVWQVNMLEKNVEHSVGHKESEIVNLQDDIELTEEEFEDIPSNADLRLATKLRQFRNFYLLVVGYIYATRIIVYLFATMLGYRFTWLREFVVELVTIIFYVTVGMQFRPMVENPYLQLKRDEAKPAPKVLEMTMKDKKMQD